MLAQEPQTVYSFVKELKPNSFYLEQMDAWQHVIDEEPSNAYAWYMLYQANRYVSIDDEPWETRTARLDSIVKQMEAHVPGSFEYHVAKYRQGGGDLSLGDHILKAYELGPNRVEVFSEIATYYALTGETKKHHEVMRKWYQSGDNSPALLNYNFNMLAGLEQNAILVTVGDNDTYPVWKMQYGEDKRKDVLVLNVHLLGHNDYRKIVFEELGIIWDNDPWESKESGENFKRELIRILATNKVGRPVYVAISTGKEYTESVSDDLYLTGLTFKYSTDPVDNLALLKNNFERNYALDYLEVQFGSDMTREIVDRMNWNYIVPLLTLYDHYELAGDLAGMQRAKSLAITVSEGSPDEKEVKSYFEK